MAPNLGRGGEQDHYERGDDGVGGDRAEEQATEDGAGGRANGHDGEEAAVVVQDGEVAVAAVAGERDQHRGQDTASDRLPAVLMSTANSSTIVGMRSLAPIPAPAIRPAGIRAASGRDRRPASGRRCYAPVTRDGCLALTNLAAGR